MSPSRWLLCSLLIAVVSCFRAGGGGGGADGSTGDSQVRFEGVLAGQDDNGNVSGTFSVTFDPGDPAGAGTAIVRSGLGVVTQSSVNVSPSGSGDGFGISVGSMQGTGRITGGGVVFTASLSGSQNERCNMDGTSVQGVVQRFCGTYSGDDVGTWNFVVSNGVVAGSFSGRLASGSFTGSATNNSVTLLYQGSTLGTGTFSASSANGTWSALGASGTWTSDPTACPRRD